MTPHPDQLTPQETAQAVAALAGCEDRAERLCALFVDLKHKATHVLPLAVQATAGGDEAADLALSTAQVEAADTAAEILAALDLLAARIALARPALAGVLAQADDAAFAAAHFGEDA